MGVGIIPVGRTDAEVDAELDALPSRYATPITGGPHSKALQRARIALANRNSAPMDIVHFGDSITWDLVGLSLQRRWAGVLRDTLRTRFPNTSAITGGHGFISCARAYGAYAHTDAMVTNDGGSVAGPNFGPDLMGIVMTASGHGCTITFTGTGLDLFYAQYGGGGTFSYAVDGGGATNIVTNGSSNFAARNQAIRGLSNTSHTVVIRWVSGGTAYFNGAFAYNGDESVGIRSWVLSWPGTSSSYWWDTNHYWSNHFTTNIAADLVTIELGPNDYGLASPIPVATFKSNVQAMIAAIKTNQGYSPSFVLIPTWPLTPNGTPLGTWQQYVDAMYEIAAADPDNVCICDWMQRTTSTTGTTVNGILGGDFTHPSTLGNRYLGEQLAQFVSPY